MESRRSFQDQSSFVSQSEPGRAPRVGAWGAARPPSGQSQQGDRLSFNGNRTPPLHCVPLTQPPPPPLHVDIHRSYLEFHFLKCALFIVCLS